MRTLSSCTPQPGASGLSRRRLMQFAAAGASGVALGRSYPAAAEVDPEELAALLAVSRRLVGGGNLQPGRLPQLFDLISEDRELLWGLRELAVTLENGELPVEGGEEVPGHRQAQDCAAAILAYWYASEWNGDATADRATAYYGAVAWQAMYTSVWAVCRAMDSGTTEPRTTPMIPANPEEPA